uniref:Uncharacterized protein n=1 Tax=Sphenodon punctatus TaxID=8508 RepID=A0A8D0GEX6_SPHPU
MVSVPMGSSTCNCSHFPALGEVQGNCAMWGLLGALALSHLLSLALNIACCARRWRRDEPGRFSLCFRRSGKTVAEDVPLYGNISYFQAGRNSGFETAAEAESLEGQDSSPQKPVCYANLKMKTPQDRQQQEPGGECEIQYTDVLVMGTRQLEPLNEREAAWPQGKESDLYASIHLERVTAKFTNQDYANKHTVPG